MCFRFLSLHSHDTRKSDRNGKKKDGSKGKTKLTLIIKSDSKITKEEYMNIYNATTEHSDVLLSFMGYADPADKTILFLESLTA